ncbi:MAG: hypothetical protein ACHQQQ_07890 [Bacteroidota bacterium]
MRRLGILIVLASALSTFRVLSQERLYSISFYGSYTTSSKLYYSPDDPNDIVRAQNIPIDQIFGIGFDVRRSFGESGVQIGLSVERLYKTQIEYLPVDPSGYTPITDGYLVFPVEFTGYFTIPFSNETVQMYMGGGGGAYFGERQYVEGGTSARVIDKTTNFGIHVLTGLQFNFQSSLAVRCEVKFRDVQFKSTNAFTTPITYDNGNFIPLSTQPFDSRISIDGIVMMIGLAYRF